MRARNPRSRLAASVLAAFRGAVTPTMKTLAFAVPLALLAGAHTFGILGALLAVPLLSISQSVFLHFREVALGPVDSTGEPRAVVATATPTG